MPHFFINTINKTENIIKINDADNYRHIVKALRTKVGENLLLIDENQIQYETVVKEVLKDGIVCEIKKSYPSLRDLEFDLYLAQSPLRSDAQLTIMEKATELGVRGVYPILTDNCVLKINKQEKWQRIMNEASKQCERAKIPTCYNACTLEEVLENKFDKILVMAERSTEVSFKEYIAENPVKKGEKVLVIIGPEGGFSQREFDFFKSKNLPMITLGDLILKAETAVIVTLGNIVYEYNG